MCPEGELVKLLPKSSSDTAPGASDSLPVPGAAREQVRPVYLYQINSPSLNFVSMEQTSHSISSDKYILHGVGHKYFQSPEEESALPLCVLVVTGFSPRLNYYH